MPNQKAKKKIDQAKVEIGLTPKADFISAILFALNLQLNDEIKTADVDGLTIRFNPRLVDALPMADVLFILLHEAWHVAFKHVARSQKLDKVDYGLYNKAADYVINDLLVLYGFPIPKMTPELVAFLYPSGAPTPLPKEFGLHDTKYRGWSTEQVYDDLKKDSDKNKPTDPNPMGTDLVQGDAKDHKGDSIPQEIVEAMTQDMLIGAAAQAKASNNYGNIPGELRRYFDKLLNPKVDWRAQLVDIVTSYSNEDYSMMRPNKKYFPDLYLPSLYSECTGHITVVQDLSGSVTKEDLTKSMTEINSIREIMDPELMTVIGFDTKISDINELQQGDSTDDIILTGGGGTDIYPVMEWGIENNPDVMIIITDGFFHNFDKYVDFPVIWLIVGNKNFKDINGTVVHYDE